MKRNVDEIIAFVIKQTGCAKSEVSAVTDIFNELSCVGDDFHELIEKYALQFNVDMSSYLWYFHADEEGVNFGGVIFKPLYARVQRIPVTPEMLLQFANAGAWMIDYPEHKIPKYRMDVYITWLFVVLIGILVFYVSC
nr:DUF1493 family protein [uncultured Lacibacter sp.]